MPRWAEIVGYSFAYEPGEAYYVPVRGPEGETVLDPAATLAVLKPVLENPNIAKIGQNLKYDAIVLRNVGVELAGASFDTMVASFLIDAGQRNYNLDDLASRYLNHTTIKIGELIGKGKDQKRMDEVPVAQVATYAAEDADIPLRLQPLLHAAAGGTGSHEAERDGRSAAHRRAGRHGIHRRASRPDSGSAELSGRYGERLVELERRNRRAGRPSAQHRLAQAARASAVRGAATAGAQEDQDRPEHRCRRAGRVGRACTRCRRRSSNTGSIRSSRIRTSTRSPR